MKDKVQYRDQGQIRAASTAPEGGRTLKECQHDARVLRQEAAKMERDFMQVDRFFDKRMR